MNAQYCSSEPYSTCAFAFLRCSRATRWRDRTRTRRPMACVSGTAQRPAACARARRRGGPPSPAALRLTLWILPSESSDGQFSSARGRALACAAVDLMLSARQPTRCQFTAGRVHVGHRGAQHRPELGVRLRRGAGGRE